MTEHDEQQPEQPELEPDVAAALQAGAGQAAQGWLDAALPMALGYQSMRAMYREQAEGLAHLLVSHNELHDALAGVIDWIDQQGVRPNWAQDRATLDNARALLERLAPQPTDGAADEPQQPQQPTDAGPDAAR